MEPAPLAVPATPQRLRALLDAGVLTPAAHDRALQLAAEPPPRAAQSAFAARAALILGGLLSLAGVVFFIAHNWDGMSRWARFGVLELGLLAFAGAAWIAKGQLTRQMALSLCAAMLGPLLAVYGQTYQTGADPYELFLTWALLAAPIAALSRFVPLWLGIWALLDLSLSLWCEQLRPLGAYDWAYSGVLTAGLNLAGLVAYEAVARRSAWLGAPVAWPRRVLTLAAVLPALPIGCRWLANLHWLNDAYWGPLAAAAVVAMCVAFGVLYQRDRFVRSTVAFAVCGLVTSLAANVISDVVNDELGAGLLGLLVVLEVTLAAAWIRRTEVAR